MTNRVYKAIEDFINKKSTNKYGVVYDAVIVEDREYVKDFLTKYYNAFKTFFKNIYDAEEVFCSKLEIFSAFRIDYTNSDIEPINWLWESLNGRNAKSNDRVVLASTGFIQNEGVVMIVPEFMKGSKEGAELAFIHELCHLFSTSVKFNKDGEFSFVTGLRIDKKKKRLIESDEGFTEYVSHLIWSKMYPNVKCSSMYCYANFVKRTKKMLKNFDDENQIIQDYFLDGKRVLKAIENKIKEKESLLNSLNL